jgi:hypothetical protein
MLNHLENVILVFFFVVNECSWVSFVVCLVIVVLVNCVKVRDSVIVLRFPSQVLFYLVQLRINLTVSFQNIFRDILAYQILLVFPVILQYFSMLF